MLKKNLKILHRGQHRRTKQRERAQHKAEQEDPDAATAAARLLDARRQRLRRNQCALALHHPPRHVVGHGLDDHADLMRLREDDAADLKLDPHRYAKAWTPDAASEAA